MSMTASKRLSSYVLVASGPGWALWYPRPLWDALTPDEQKSRQDAQCKLLGYNPTDSGNKRATNESRRIVGQSSGNAES